MGHVGITWEVWGFSTAHLSILSGTAQTTCFPSPESIFTNIIQLFSVTSSILGPGYFPFLVGVFGPPRLLCCVPEHAPPAGNDSLGCPVPWLAPIPCTQLGGSCLEPPATLGWG